MIDTCFLEKMQHSQFKNIFGQPIGFPLENWQPAKIPDKASILQGRYGLLEPIDSIKHAAVLFESLQFENSGDSWTYLPYGPFDSFEAFQIWLTNITSGEDPLLYVIMDNKTQIPIGIAGYLRINSEQGTIEVGHLHYSKHLQKTPLATEAMYLLMQQAFDVLHYRRYEWKCDALNQPSRCAAERLGFKFEGIFRQNMVYKNRSRDTAWFSIIDSEWPVLKARFQKWLDPNNFDQNGKQILSLQSIFVE